MTAITAASPIWPSPATVSADAAARCPAIHASSLRIVEGMRMPANTFLGSRSAAARRPTPAKIKPLKPLRNVRFI